MAGVAQGLERQPSKLRVAGSNPVSRSNFRWVALDFRTKGSVAAPGGSKGGAAQVLFAHVAQSVEHILGKDEVTSSILVVGSILQGGMVYEKYYYTGMLGMQTSQLHDDEEQTDDAEQV